MKEGLSFLGGMGGKGCALLEDPNYYKRFGFRNILEFITDQAGILIIARQELLIGQARLFYELSIIF